MPETIQPLIITMPRMIQNDPDVRNYMSAIEEQLELLRKNYNALLSESASTTSDLLSVSYARQGATETTSDSSSGIISGQSTIFNQRLADAVTINAISGDWIFASNEAVINFEPYPMGRQRIRVSNTDGSNIIINARLSQSAGPYTDDQMMIFTQGAVYDFEFNVQFQTWVIV